ncbi:MAG: F390 synthetase-related protein [Candidatus Heimdallarchaeaceae archaeon]
MNLENNFLSFFLACKYRFKNLKGEKLQRYQENRLKKIVDYSVKNSPFFKRYYSNYNINDVFNLPTVNKHIMMENLSEYNTVGFTKEELINFCLEVERSRDFSKRYKKYNVAMSSGTSGNKGIVITSPKEERYLKAAFFARFPFPRTLKLNIAFILRVSTPAFNINKFGQKLTHFSLLDPLEEIVENLNSLQPNILSAPPSMLNLLADEYSEGKLCIKPKKIISYAEILYPDIRKKVEETFGIRIDEIYQASEGPIAMTCKHGSLHINEDLLVLQTLNEDGSPTEKGELCHKLIVSDLYKTSQPIIRFELNDMIRIRTEKCTCGSGFRIIDEIVGRTDDLLIGVNSSTGQVHYIFPDYIRRAIISSSEQVIEYQAIQTSKNRLEISIQLSKDKDEFQNIKSVIKRAIEQVFKTYNCEIPDVTVKISQSQLHPVSKKLIRIQRKFSIA